MFQMPQKASWLGSSMLPILKWARLQYLVIMAENHQSYLFGKSIEVPVKALSQKEAYSAWVSIAYKIGNIGPKFKTNRFANLGNQRRHMGTSSTQLPPGLKTPSCFSY